MKTGIKFLGGDGNACTALSNWNTDHQQIRDLVAQTALITSDSLIPFKVLPQPWVQNKTLVSPDGSFVYLQNKAQPKE